ncbi:PREDICTED: ethanolamine kinase 1-like, partial [Priapulus caudatus]|uniref:ethanolamine kinase n=1 Tax=Priapulus caudatus TaxID=37621 RepID=A0ABM1F4W2_PRICU
SVTGIRTRGFVVMRTKRMGIVEKEEDEEKEEEDDVDYIMYVDIMVNDANAELLRRDVFAIIRTVRSSWKEKDLRLKVFNDGITNKIVGVYDDGVGGDGVDGMLLLRIYGENTDLLIDRDAEMRNLTRLHAAGCCPPLHARFNNGLCYGYAVGICPTAGSVTSEPIYRLTATMMARIHSIRAKPGQPTDPCLFTVFHRWLDMVPESFADTKKNDRYRKFIPKIKTLRTEVEVLERHLVDLDSPVVFCHNDLLLNNIVYNKSEGTVTFIDYEYAAFNYQAFDIGNHFAVYCCIEEPNYRGYPKRRYKKRWLREYLAALHAETGRGVTATELRHLYVQVNSFIPAAHLFWAVWGLIQSYHSDIGFDYLG